MTKERPSEFDFNAALKRISGDEQDARAAFRELHDHFGTTIYVKAKRFLKSQAMADDLVQEVFTTVWVKRKELNHVLDFKGYLIGITKREALEVIRKSVSAELIKKKHLEMMEAQPDPIPVEHSMQFDKLVELLPAPRKQIFEKFKIQGLSQKVIADQFDISVDMVHYHVRQAVKFIKERKHDAISILLTGIAFIQQFAGRFDQ